MSALPVPLAANVTVTPLTGFPYWSRSVAVTVATLPPALATMLEGATASCEFVRLTGPAMPVAVKETPPDTPLTLADSVFAPASVPRVQEVSAATPAAPVDTAVGTTAPAPDVTPNCTATPGTGLPNASVTRTAGAMGTAVPTWALWVFPARIAIAAAVAALTATVAVCVIATPAIVAETVFPSATVALTLPVATPLALVVPTGCVSVFPVPVAAKVTVAPLIGLPPASFAVTVIVLALDPVLAVIAPGATLTVDCVALTLPPPALRAIDPDVTAATPGALKRRV